MSRNRFPKARIRQGYISQDQKQMPLFIVLLLALIVLFFFLAKGVASADEAILLTQHSGIGARAMGMGGVAIAVSEDFSALYLNPAGLTQVRRIEISGNLSHQKYTAETIYFGNAEKDHETNTRLNALGVVFPVPTYRGSLVFALGAGRVENFDALFVQRGYSVEDEWLENGREIQSGGLYSWSIGGAVDISPTLSFGVSINLLDGDYNYDWDAYFADINDVYIDPPYDTTYIYDTIKADFDALSLQIGGLLRLSRFFKAGWTISSPMTYDVSGDMVERTWDVFDNGAVDQYTDSFYFQNEISTPWEFGFGLAWAAPTLLLAGDLRYAAWGEMKFDESPSYLTSTPWFLKKHRDYRDVLSWSIGGEYILPYVGTKIRIGYASEPIAYRLVKILKDRKAYSLGAGFLVGQVMTLDLAWVRQTWKTAETSLIVEDQVDQLFTTLAYRF